MEQRPTKTLSDGSYLCYRRGKFDMWQVRRIWPGRARYEVPLDQEILALLARLAARFGARRVYRDFCAVYRRTDREPRQAVLELASSLAEGYANARGAAEYLFSVLYMTMVSEENKEGTLLGRRIKALAVHQVLLEEMSPADAADFSRDRTAAQLALLCEERGIPR